MWALFSLIYGSSIVASHDDFLLNSSALTKDYWNSPHQILICTCPIHITLILVPMGNMPGENMFQRSKHGKNGHQIIIFGEFFSFFCYYVNMPIASNIFLMYAIQDKFLC